MAAILARKLGMTQRFLEDGRVERVTVLEAGPCPVTAVRSNDSDGYEAVQLGYGEVKEKRLPDLDDEVLVALHVRSCLLGRPEWPRRRAWPTRRAGTMSRCSGR